MWCAQFRYICRWTFFRVQIRRGCRSELRSLLDWTNGRRDGPSDSKHQRRERKASKEARGGQKLGWTRLECTELCVPKIKVVCSILTSFTSNLSNIHQQLKALMWRGDWLKRKPNTIRSLRGKVTHLINPYQAKNETFFRLLPAVDISLRKHICLSNKRAMAL